MKIFSGIPALRCLCESSSNESREMMRAALLVGMDVGGGAFMMISHSTNLAAVVLPDDGGAHERKIEAAVAQMC